MSPLDRSLADYKGTGMTVGPQIVKHLRTDLDREGVLRAVDVKTARNGRWAKIAGLVIVRQRPGTAKGMCFLTLEDETGTANAAVRPDIFQQHRALIHTAAFLLVEGPVQNVDGVVHVLARRLKELRLPRQPIGLKGSGYRMRVTPEERQASMVGAGVSEGADEKHEHEPPSMPKSHDFR
jgi:error-prone DNA polymerase